MDAVGFIKNTIENRICTIEFGHSAGNSFPTQLLNDLTEAFDNQSGNDNVSVIILKSQGIGAFCAGASFDELLSIKTMDEGGTFFSGFANVLNAMRKCSKIVVGRIHGKSVGGGLGLIAACDYAMATDEASVKLSELAIGIGPFVIAPAVERKIGLAALADLSLNPTEWKSAQWAKQQGLYSQTFSNASDLDNAIHSFCEKLASYNPDALAEFKRALWHDTEHWSTLLYERAAISGNLVLSDFTKSALAKMR